MGFKPLAKNITILNLLLILCLVWFIHFRFLPLWNAGVPDPPLPPKKVLKKEIEKESLPPQPPLKDFICIAEQNLFHPERKIPSEKKEEQALPKPEFVLYGTLITGSQTLAYMEDKKSVVTTPGRGKRQTVLKKGEILSGFTLTEVLEDQVILVRGQETITVKLNDPQSPKFRDSGDPRYPVPKSPSPNPPPSPAPSSVPPNPGIPVRRPPTTPLSPTHPLSPVPRS